MPRELVANRFATVLAGDGLAASSADTSAEVADAAPVRLQNGQWRAAIYDLDGSGQPQNLELVLVTGTGAAGASPYTIVRAREAPGDVALAHPAGSILKHIPTARGLMGMLLDAPDWDLGAALYGWLAMTCDPWLCNADIAPPSRAFHMQIPFTQTMTPTNIDFMIRTTPAAGMVGAGLGLYLAERGSNTAEKISSDVDLTAVLTSVGWKALSFAVPQAIEYEQGRRLYVRVWQEDTTKSAFRGYTQGIAEFRTNGALGRGNDKPSNDLGNVNGLPANYNVTTGVGITPSRYWFGLRDN